jgi:hypothetical protein
MTVRFETCLTWTAGWEHWISGVGLWKAWLRIKGSGRCETHSQPAGWSRWCEPGLRSGIKGAGFQTLFPALPVLPERPVLLVLPALPALPGAPWCPPGLGRPKLLISKRRRSSAHRPRRPPPRPATAARPTPPVRGAVAGARIGGCGETGAALRNGVWPTAGSGRPGAIPRPLGPVYHGESAPSARPRRPSGGEGGLASCERWRAGADSPTPVAALRRCQRGRGRCPPAAPPSPPRRRLPRPAPTILPWAGGVARKPACLASLGRRGRLDVGDVAGGVAASRPRLARGCPPRRVTWAGR